MIESPEQVQATIEQLKLKAASIDGEVVNLKRAKIAGQLDIQRLLKQKEELEDNISALSIKEQEQLESVKEFEALITRLEQKHADTVADYEVLSDSETSLKASIDGLEDREKELQESISKSEYSLKEVETQLTNKRGKLKTLVEKVSQALKVSLVAAAILVPLAIGVYVLMPEGFQEVVTQLIE